MMPHVRIGSPPDLAVWAPMSAPHSSGHAAACAEQLPALLYGDYQCTRTLLISTTMPHPDAFGHGNVANDDARLKRDPRHRV
jgi:hypothetical protein